MKHRIKDLIKEKGYTQQQFAEKMGITRSTFMQQVHAPSYPVLTRIAETLGVEAWELFASRDEILANHHSEVTCPKCGQRFDLKN